MHHQAFEHQLRIRILVSRALSAEIKRVCVVIDRKTVLIARQSHARVLTVGNLQCHG